MAGTIHFVSVLDSAGHHWDFLWRPSEENQAALLDVLKRLVSEAGMPLSTALAAAYYAGRFKPRDAAEDDCHDA